MCTGFIKPRLRTSVKLLWTQSSTFRFHKMCRIYRLTTTFSRLTLFNAVTWDNQLPQHLCMVSSKPYHSTVNNFKHHLPVNVWCCPTDNKLTGPFIRLGHLIWDHHTYLKQDDLPHILEDVPLQVRLSVWSQHDSIQPHFLQ
jgi:hypothetical protein